ncbi:MAG: c-type cytochrome, partial [Bacteroidota bacterium]
RTAEPQFGRAAELGFGSTISPIENLSTMKKVLKILGILLGSVLVLLLGVAAWIQFSGFKTYESKDLAIQVPSDSATVLQGKKIVETLCVGCHLGEDGKLTGKLFSRASDDFGEIWSGNITQHPEFGIGEYTNGQLAYLLRTGIKQDGSWAGPYMSFPRMSDAHVASIIAYLRSDSPLVQPAEATHPAPNYSFLAKALVKLGAFVPYPYEEKPIAAPPSTDKLAYGRYLATAVYECANCHSASYHTNNLFEPEKSPGYFGGGNPIPDDDFKIIPSANLTPHPEAGLGKWTEAQFAHAVRAGARPDERILSPIMPRFALLNDEELGAIWAYLQTVPPLESATAKAGK